MNILQVGGLEPQLAELVALRYQPLVLPPPGEERERFLAEHGPAVKVILASGGRGLDDELFAALPELEAVVNNGAGVDNIDLAAAGRRGIGVSNTPDVLSDTVADTAIGLILMCLRRFGSADRFVREGRWATEGVFPYARDLTGSTVGILGLGRLGNAVATRLLAFDCTIAYHNRRRIEGSPYRYAASARELAESVDILVVATAGGKGTEKLVDREVLTALGPQGYLINIARGTVVDEAALIELLSADRLAGAGLDVFADEPHVPAALRALDNVVLFPHIGSATARTRRAMAELTLRNLESYLRTGQLVTPVLRPEKAP
ncbi:hydroxyacid dehydrogenase [Mycolicibacterium chitae]|uniref:D-3-phosphoglycerate dehydrogenase n=1 Tax=Mycolicibacterium chitae TaxID=1792 RepID=A0A448I1J8_MYCCI|nr:2-hydroxyacid dehydrogenase [Mycolicibacterium chitae]MCV7106249.1 2-hydroxyacid dehydrogenase [Mycolicibacterium chitae]BBZ03131.1 hydroxyacid dehydrogenase [Mycolicibacterium chitae]VEG46368.1 D-3-phosphoglycerate dehydrogenase [Mycolicibacterium chitae]